MHDPQNRDTRYLADRYSNTDGFIPVRATGPLSSPLPWVIEFRVVGTPETIQVQVHESMLIGRADPSRSIRPAVDLSPHNGQSLGVSRQHTLLSVKDNRIMVRDLKSINGTRLNGFLLSPDHEYRLRHGDELEIGSIKLQVRFTVEPTLGRQPRETGPLQQPIPHVGSGQHILIADDDAHVAKVFSMMLRSAGFRVTLVNSGAAVIGMGAMETPALLIMELMLPDMNGLDVLKYLRKQPDLSDVPVIVCSGATGGFQMHQALTAGASLFLGKPISVDDLIKAVAQLLHLELLETDQQPKV